MKQWMLFQMEQVGWSVGWYKWSEVYRVKQNGSPALVTPQCALVPTERRATFFFNSGFYRKLESNWKITNLIVHEFTAPLACVSAFESNVWVLECASEEDRERKQPTSRGEVETEVSWKGRGQHIAMAVARIRLAAHLLLLLSNPKSWTKATSETLPRLIITSPGRFGNFLSCSVPNRDLIYVASRNFWLAI